MVRKKIDERIRTLIENGVKTRHRSFFLIIGDENAHNQIVNLHDILSRSVKKSKPKVLWCYKDQLQLTSHKAKRGKRAKPIKKLMSNPGMDPEKSVSLFRFGYLLPIAFHIKSKLYCSRYVLICIVLYFFHQDFEALTPNLLARTIETVEGGGLVILLLHSLKMLTSLYTMVMDVHERFRTESHSLATGRFNERFLLSLASCGSCMVIDDELNILPISSHMKSITPVQVQEDSEGLLEAERDLKALKEQLKDDFPVGPLINKCCTSDQGKAVITCLDAILDKTLRNTVALIAGRGRGKSAALGFAVAGAVAAGYSNIYVTAPSPENLKTLFEFVELGFGMLEYKEHLDYDIVRSSNPELRKVAIRINIYKQHRQTIQYIQPHEHEKLSQVELLVIDEAAAIPLPVVKSLFGPYVVFLSSTVNGYEGTGRSLSLKLLQQLKEQSVASTKTKDANPNSGRSFRQIDLTESIRYAPGDLVESWLNNLLCLDIVNSVPIVNRSPLPSECNLYYVNRDTLFSYHKDSELFLQRMMALYVASHYKNSPNDLQLLADAPAHHLFVLLGPVDESSNKLPDILCVIQICFEGKISKDSALNSLRAGHQPSGDQIPWKFCQQFQDEDFPSLSGARIVRIATHPDAMKLGYGSTAIKLLARYFEGEFTNLSDEAVVQNDRPEPSFVRITEAAEKASLREENIKPRSDLPALLEPLSKRPHEKLHYLGVSFGLTLDLFRFWRRCKFAPFYLCQIPNPVTGEHTCMMLKPLHTDDIEVTGSDELGFVAPFYQAFRSSVARRLCSPRFNTMEYKLAVSILDSDPKLSFTDVDPPSTISHDIYGDIFKSSINMKRLKAYVNQQADYHLISDLTHSLAYLYFEKKLPVSLSCVQTSILLCMGLQNQDASYVERVMKLEKQVMSQFFKVMNKFHKYLDSISTKEFNSTLPQVKEDDFKASSDNVLNSEFSQRYAIADKDVEFASALQNGDGNIPPGGVISVESSKTKVKKIVTRKEAMMEVPPNLQR
ncbi:RNA cytidine acetyltransferase 1-like [Bidens hawaiensis]|uniref:RNA cytidine acetyltransferase 1-like n=1 Tax=Bidens hawaiensis TaxID=980011 RepID=UPI00404A8215